MVCLSPFLALLTTAAAFTIPSWSELQSNVSPLYRPFQIKPPVYTDEVPPDVLESNLPILYRDKNCIDLNSQIVWLAMECKNIDYITILVDTAEDVPRIIWPDNESTPTVSDPTQLLEQIQARYPEPIPFYPKISVAVDASRSNIMRLPGVMPRNSDPSLMSASPFLFRTDEVVAKSSHCVSLEELEEMMEEYEGPYICGEDLTAADIVWMPYLERYSIQLPLVFPKIEVLNPRSSAYEMVAEWMKSVESIPAYACVVRGDARHWRRCLEKSVEVNNSRCEEKVSLPPLPKRKRWWIKNNPKSDALWESYCYKNGERVRPWLGDTPTIEAALFLFRHRDAIVDAFVADSNHSSEITDEALRVIISQLTEWNADDGKPKYSDTACKLLEYTIDRLDVPKDLGMIPALALFQLLETMEACNIQS
jgi:glutathione S-transferase